MQYKKTNRDLNKALTLYVTKFFVYFTLNDISEVALVPYFAIPGLYLLVYYLTL